MQPYQQEFLDLAVEHEVLRFGEFTLKSGRISPYFFNLGRIAGGSALARLARAYADALECSGVQFDMLFGPAYKGIPLVAALAVEFASRGRDLPFAYDRKEAKDHGEGGVLVGAPPQGRVLIVDDVLTAGTALRKSIELLRQAGADPVAAAIALDRQECGSSGRSAVQELGLEAGIQVIPLVSVADVLDYLAASQTAPDILQAMRSYQQQYGI